LFGTIDLRNTMETNGAKGSIVLQNIFLCETHTGLQLEGE